MIAKVIYLWTFITTVEHCDGVNNDLTITITDLYFMADFQKNAVLKWRKQSTRFIVATFCRTDLRLPIATEGDRPGAYNKRYLTQWHQFSFRGPWEILTKLCHEYRCECLNRLNGTLQKPKQKQCEINTM